MMWKKLAGEIKIQKGIRRVISFPGQIYVSGLISVIFYNPVMHVHDWGYLTAA